MITRDVTGGNEKGTDNTAQGRNQKFALGHSGAGELPVRSRRGCSSTELRIASDL